MKKTLATALVTATLLSGCMTYDPYSGEQKVSNATKGTAIGAVTGAAIGALAGGKKNRGKGALIGAVAGGATGGGIGYYMDRQEAELRQRLMNSGVQVVRNGDQIQLIMPGNITFESNQSSIRPAFHPVLQSVASVLTEFTDTAIQIAGHTDSTGALSYNMLLSEQRANSVKDFLLSQGIPISRVRATGYGPKMPVASNDTPAGREQNRRVELTLVPIQQ